MQHNHLATVSLLYWRIICTGLDTSLLSRARRELRQFQAAGGRGIIQQARKSRCLFSSSHKDVCLLSSSTGRTLVSLASLRLVPQRSTEAHEHTSTRAHSDFGI